ncbi:putative cysteine-rich receptor-like protein kinase 35 [Nymphaea thermarum]|nr:putative cysteine-rich receptor-like protein kinase 35 [Nymphaea thermarum]
MCRTACCFTFLVVLFQPLGFVDMTETPFWYCFGSSNYTANSTFSHNLQRALNSTFSHNLQRALASVVADVSLTSFYNVTVGNSPDQALATAQCRGDLDGEACQVCVSNAASQVAQLCPQKRAAIIFFESCIMYYRDANFTVPQSFMNLSLPRLEAIPDPQRFRPMLISFFNKLILSTTTNPSGRLFWGDMFRYSRNLTIYATAQCVQYLSHKGCRSCLDIAFAQMLKNFGDRQGGVVYHNIECLVRFEPFPFFTPPPHKIDPNSGGSFSSNCSQPTSSNKVGTPFHKNLKALLSYLIENAPLSGFYNDNVGLGSGQVYGQAMCRGDILDDVCWHCTAQASSKIQELCPNSRRAIIWLDHCQLRYSDENFGGMVDVSDRACQPAEENASNPTSFYQTLRSLISNLTSLAMQSSSNHFFATGMSVIPDSQRIYALVQCVGDIPVDRCRWCLQNASSDIEGCFNGKQGGSILRGSCIWLLECSPSFLAIQHWYHFRSRITVIVQKKSHNVNYLLHVILEMLKQKEATSIDTESVKENEEANYDLPQISLRTIEDATDNFSKSNKLGEGGYGPVYKGKLPNGQEVALKRLSGRSGQGLKEFKNEVELIVKLQHVNLVRLIACCLEKGEKMLIYEYMPNKSLDFFLKDPESRVLLDWEKRFNIIIGIARGMLYLHQDSRLNVIHRDLKASNVLLDEQLNPKISDFGLARIFSGVQGQATTSVIVGTYGYMAPEYAMDGVFSTKSDVYSFGILLFEIISGQLNSASMSAILLGRSLVEHAWSLWCEEKGTEFVDPVLKDAATSTSNQMLRCLHIGFLCIQEDPATRPTMSTVVLMLGNDSVDLPLPKQPASFGENVADSSQQCSSVITSVASEITAR